jgi:hypothetical protein
MGGRVVGDIESKSKSNGAWVVVGCLCRWLLGARHHRNNPMGLISLLYLIPLYPNRSVTTTD